jgi:glucokinase
VADGAHGAAGEPLTTGQVFAQAGSNAQPQQMVSGALDALAAHIADLALVVDPATIAVGGEFAHVAGIMLPRLRATLERTVPVPPTVRVARFTQDATVVAAVALALALDAALLSGRPASAPPQDDRPAPHEHRKAS